MNTMTMERFNELTRKSTTKEVIVNLIKAKDPCVRKIRPGRYEILDESGNVFIRTKNLKIS